MRGVRRWWQVVAAALLACGLAASGLVGQAQANGEPVELELRYLDGVSNFGPRDATARVRIVMYEGDIRISGAKLVQQGGTRFEGWLVDTKTGAQRSIGKFDAARDGTVSFTNLIDNFGEPEFDLVMITVEPEPDPSAAPDARVALAARRVPLAAPSAVTAVPREGGGTGTGTVPVLALPRTGLPALDPTLAATVGSVLLMLGGLGARAARRRR